MYKIYLLIIVYLPGANFELRYKKGSPCNKLIPATFCVDVLSFHSFGSNIRPTCHMILLLDVLEWFVLFKEVVELFFEAIEAESLLSAVDGFDRLLDNALSDSLVSGVFILRLVEITTELLFLD